MKTKWREIIAIVIALLLISLVISGFAGWDAAKPSDSDPVTNWPALIRANNDALEVVFGVDLSGVSTVANVKSTTYGAIGDGVEDDSAAFQAAFDSGARYILIPTGTYLLESAVTLPTTRGCVIAGMGESSLIFGDFVGKLFEVKADRTQIKDLAFAGGTNITDCIYSDSFHRGELYNISIHRSGGDAIHLQNCYMWTIFRFKCRWDQETVKTSYPRVAKGIHLTPGASACVAITIIDPLIEEATDAIYVVDSDSIRVRDGVLENNYGYAYYATGSNKLWLSGGYLERNRVTSGDAKSLMFEDCSIITLQDIHFSSGNEGVYLNNIVRFVLVSGPIATLEFAGTCQEVVMWDRAETVIGFNNLSTGIQGLNIIRDSSDNKLHFIKGGDFRIGGNLTGTNGIIEFDSDGISIMSGDKVVLGVGREGTESKILVNLGNNSITYGTAAPTNYTWARGDVRWNTTPSASGTPGWVNTSSGTFTAATDNTGDTDGNTAVITGMADTSDFSVGHFITTSAGFPNSVDNGNVPVKIISIDSATQITIDDTSDSVESNITVLTPDPIFKAMANLAA